MLLKNDSETFGQYITRLREAKGYSQRKLAMISGLSNTTIGRIEKSETENPDLLTLTTLAKHLNVDESYILQAAGYIESKTSIKKENKINDKIAHAVNDDPELLTFWEEMKERESLQLLFKQARALDDKDIKQIIRIIKAIEDEEDKEE